MNNELTVGVGKKQIDNLSILADVHSARRLSYYSDIRMSQNCNKRCCFVSLVLCTIIIVHINLDLLHGNVSNFASRFKSKVPSLPVDKR